MGGRMSITVGMAICQVVSGVKVKVKCSTDI